MMHLLALDPSMRCTGYVVQTLEPRALIVAGAIPTRSTVSRSPKPRALVLVHDEGRRGTEISRGIAGLLLRYSPAVVALEAPIGAQDVTAATALARANQAVRSAIALTCPDVVVLSVSAHAAKQAATGSKRADKADVREAAWRQWGLEAWGAACGPGIDSAAEEAAADANAVALVALRHPAVRLVIHDARRAKKGTFNE